MRHAAPRLSVVAALVAAAALAGCLAGHPRLAAPEAPAFQPEAFFEGVTRGTGTLAVRGRRGQTVRVESVGAREDDGAFRLDQTIWIGDAAPRQRTWRMRRGASGAYTSTLTDARGPVAVEVRGAELRIRYRMSAVTTMHQTLVLRPDGRSALNRATIRVLGVPVARLTEEIVRVDG